ncbi:sigma 54-interacting transcriptional regulator [Enterococcus timonensis]|uniref:sigma 54-interacting transcriptional regulator n=1 Tax=Enterococcus timonensis TaxID=1852364 RepID=UPI0008DAF394|nr:sigma-54-dependent transcriptional regulator [Enterococcus timonensis]
MSNRKDEILILLKRDAKGLTASAVADRLALDRTNVSRYLSELAKEKLIIKSNTRPVVYQFVENITDEISQVSFNSLVGVDDSLKVVIQQAKAAILYPPRGLHTIIFGKTGTGKSLFAECMYQFAIESESLEKSAPFVSFNCADYAQNPQLLFAHIFGVKKGAFTGANEDRTGLVAQADGGILFLDEIHRLPPEGQEMLFTFIDKGIYRPLGESAQSYEASVQIIGATTESSENFLTTFNRRIPMSITLPSLDDRTLDERYEIISLFIKQEANRLHQKIHIEREAVLAFMLYHAEGNIGQVKRDLKLVCAKAFLHYRTHNEDSLTIHKEDLPLQVQKGLLKMKEVPDRLDHFVDKKAQFLTFEPGESEVVWSQDPTQSMDVYNSIEAKVEEFSKKQLEVIDLESLISRDVDAYFTTYVKELTRSSIHEELISDQLWDLTNRLYDYAESILQRKYGPKARFAFSLHLQSTLERLREGHIIVHPDLNNVRKKFSKEFQVAIDLSGMIEAENDVEIPFDEIGFISMFLSIDVGEMVPVAENNVRVIVLMHGKSTASSMLETVQELLGTQEGMAMNMPLTLEVQKMYEQLKNYIIEYKEVLTNGVLLLTDMGSLNAFGTMIYEETGVRTKAITMSSTLVVLEAVRMSTVGRSLEDIYQNIQLNFESAVREQFANQKNQLQKKKAIVVACFTGEGVAARLYQRIHPVVNHQKVEVIQMQFIEKTTFKKHIDNLLKDYQVIAIAGTVDVDYQNIPFFSALDLFQDDQLNILKRIANEELSVEKIAQSLEQTITEVPVLSQFVLQIQRTLRQIQNDLKIILEPGVDTGLIMHVAVLFDSILKGQHHRDFPNLAVFQKKYRLEMDTVRTNFMLLEKNYHLRLPEAELAFLTQMLLENQLHKSSDLHTIGSV